MPYPTLTAEEIARRGEEIYERDLRAKLETEENRGQFLIIDITTGGYEIDREDPVATERLLAPTPGSPHRPDAALPLCTAACACR